MTDGVRDQNAGADGAEGPPPPGTVSARDVVDRCIAEMADAEIDLERLVATPSGLDLDGICAALADPWFREPGRQAVSLQMMCDFMEPTESMYFDAIYGDFHGQHAIRNWLVPIMATIEFVEFVPTQPGAIFDDGHGGTSLDEWQMFAKLGEERFPLSRGVSVRRFRDGWLTWACDVYDTGPFRVPPPPELLPDADLDASDAPEPLPDWPRTRWQREPGLDDVTAASIDPDALADRFHPTDSVVHDPVAGEVRGRDAIRAWLSSRIESLGTAVFEPLGPRLDDGTTSVQEWQQMSVDADGSRHFMTRGTSVRRRTDGLITYAADYYDTASLPT